MEELYSKLYKKYKELKNEKESQFDKLNRDQEEKFLEYVAAADEMIHYLKSENDKLHGQVKELKSELASIRSSNDGQNTHYQKLLMEENQKNKELLEEITRLKSLEHNECSHCTAHEKDGHRHKRPHEDTQGEGSPSQSVNKLTKKHKYSHTAEGSTTPQVVMEHVRPENQHAYADKGGGVASSIQKPTCCQRSICISGGDGSDSTSVNCVFQSVVELVVGLKVSPLNQNNEMCILALHQSSGYSFSLTGITNSKGETELLYRVLSLGTFEKVAPEWMKETIIFATSMCRIFFDRVSRVIKS